MSEEQSVQLGASGMASLSKSQPLIRPRTNPISFNLSRPILSFRFCPNASSLLPLRLCALNTGSDADNLLRKPVVSPAKDLAEIVDEDDKEADVKAVFEDDSEDERWVDWEDQILEDTVPLVGFVRMILHSGK